MGAAILISLVCFSASQPLSLSVPTFLGVALTALVANDAHDMRLSALRIDGVTHGFAVNRQRFIELPVLGVPGVERPIQLRRVHRNQDITNHGTAGYFVLPVSFSAAKTAAGVVPQRLRP